MKEETCKVVCGGPMMGHGAGRPERPRGQGHQRRALPDRPRARGREPDLHPLRQVHQGLPHGLQPLQLYRYVNAGMKDELERFNLEDCMECGCCSYVCPGRLPLVETFKAGKKLLKEGKRK